jgi:hypothetical protein
MVKAETLKSVEQKAESREGVAIFFCLVGSMLRNFLSIATGMHSEKPGAKSSAECGLRSAE